jgi:hypothetical protein
LFIFVACLALFEYVPLNWNSEPSYLILILNGNKGDYIPEVQSSRRSRRGAAFGKKKSKLLSFGVKITLPSPILSDIPEQPKYINSQTSQVHLP